MSLARRLILAAAAGATAAATALVPTTAAHAASAYSLVILPDQGESAIYNFVNSATKSVDVTIYELRDTTLVSDLVNKQKAGVQVRVILDAQHTSIDGPAYSALQAAGAGVTYSSSAYVYTHQKTITVDGVKSYISTGNFDTTYYATSRDYGVFDTDAADVAAIEQVFNADFTSTAITPSDGTDLVWSPTDSQNQLLNLINGAQHSLDVEQEEFGDTAMVNAIVADAQRGVTVRVVAEDTSAKYTTQFNQVTAAGGKVTTYTSNTGFYVHAKAIVADYGTASAKVFAGSENFSDNSLNHNRELGLIISDSAVISGIESTINADFNRTSSAGVTVTNPGNQTGTVGTAAGLQIGASDSASGQTLSYSATGLPAGLTVNSTTGLISGTPTASGTSSVTVSATDTTGAGGSAAFTWTVNPASSGCTPAQLLGNPGFETGTASPWTAGSGVISNDTTNEPPHSGSWDAWLDGYGTTHTDTLAQTVSIPTGCTNDQLSFWLHVDTTDPSTTTAYHTLKVQILNSAGTVLGTLHTYSNLDATTGYAQHTFDLSAYAGQNVTLKFTGYENAYYSTSFVLDDTAVNVS